MGGHGFQHVGHMVMEVDESEICRAHRLEILVKADLSVQRQNSFLVVGTSVSSLKAFT